MLLLGSDVVSDLVIDGWLCGDMAYFACTYACMLFGINDHDVVMDVAYR
jgi:hypothetical protein